MDKRVTALGIIVLLFGVLFFALNISSQATTLAIDTFSWKATNLLLKGKLDVTVTVVNIVYTLTVKDVNGGADLAGQQVPTGTQINVIGTLIGSDNLPISGYPSVALNILPQGSIPEDGNQCWIGSSKTDAQGAFGGDGYLEVREDGWWSSYSGVGGEYIQNKNGADNPGCSAWATGNPVGKSFTVYAAISKTSFSETKTFSVIQGSIGCAVAGAVYIKASNEVQVHSGQTVRMPPSTTWRFVPSSGAASISTVTVFASGSGASQTFTFAKAQGGEWTGTVTLVTGTYTISLSAQCTGGGSKPLATLTVTVRDGPVELVTQLDLRWIAGIFIVLGVLTIGYGAYRKP